MAEQLHAEARRRHRRSVISAVGLAGALTLGACVPPPGTSPDKPAPQACEAGRLYHSFDLRGTAYDDRLVVLLTFDDGPDPGSPARASNDMRIMDILASRGLAGKAMFFNVGSNAQRAPGIVQRQVQEGYAIGAHDDDHAYPLTPPEAKDASLAEGMGLGIRMVEQVAGIEVVDNRVPGLNNSPVIQEEAKRQGACLWGTNNIPSADLGDWRAPRIDEQKIRDNFAVFATQARARNEAAIVLLHHVGPDHEPTVEALDDIINHTFSQGGVFMSRDELLTLGAQPV